MQNKYRKSTKMQNSIHRQICKQNTDLVTIPSGSNKSALTNTKNAQNIENYNKCKKIYTNKYANKIRTS